MQRLLVLSFDFEMFNFVLFEKTGLLKTYIFIS